MSEKSNSIINPPIDQNYALKKTYMLRIRKYIEFFKSEKCLSEIIGINEAHISKFKKGLHNMDSDQLKELANAIQFEL